MSPLKVGDRQVSFCKLVFSMSPAAKMCLMTYPLLHVFNKFLIIHLFPILTEKRASADHYGFLRSPVDTIPAFMYQARPRYIKRLLSSLYENANKRAPSNENMANLRGDDVSDLMSLLEMNGQE